VKEVESGMDMGRIVGGLREGFNWLQQDVVLQDLTLITSSLTARTCLVSGSYAASLKGDVARAF